MAKAEQRNIDWGTAEIEEGALTVELTGASSKAWKERFEGVLVLLDTPHSSWGEVRVNRKGIQVADVEQGRETELRHFLESIVMQVNSELPAPEQDTQDAEQDAEVDETAQADRELTAAFRAFADD